MQHARTCEQHELLPPDNPSRSQPHRSTYPDFETWLVDFLCQAYIFHGYSRHTLHNLDAEYWRHFYDFGIPPKQALLLDAHCFGKEQGEFWAV